MKEKSKSLLLVSILGSLTLAACGGGGGGDNGTATAQSASTPAAASSPAAASAPAAASSPAPALTGEALPSLTSPQAGSTATAGNGSEGIWTQSGTTNMTAFVDPASNLSYINGLFTIVTSTFFGAISTATPNWTLVSGFETIGGFRYTATPGSGTYAANQTLAGSYVANSSTVNLSLKYDPANALAVTQSSVAGTWAQTSTSITVDNAGGVTGSILGCGVTGTLALTTPGSNKNLYTMTLTGTTSTCGLHSGVTYSGSSAITFLPVTGSTTLYRRTIIYLIKAADNSEIAYGQLSKQ
ncbi:hypothetical protein B0G76_6360 [Paraburkholderia sp. BL23I1N1]|uniref:hypothetical protein n=1 Tax=Paraburkholderia sp. BL23I1N1 TaxID=1938802 RepID=UPI000FF4F03F|nr:hypothetical protein [Paraburkholderia sp. BL23I1N1]RKE39907.1 hypothetical protein B0G76_6360 [Paraburkholderia sp. BL23I1N1]